MSASIGIAACIWVYAHNATVSLVSSPAQQVRYGDLLHLRERPQLHADPDVCLAFVSGNRTDALVKTLVATLRHMQQDEPEVTFEMALVDNGTPEQELRQVTSRLHFDKVVRVDGNIGPHTAHNLFFFNLCRAPYVLTLLDECAYEKMHAGNTDKPILRALDLLRHDANVSLVNLLYSQSSERAWHGFLQTSQEGWTTTENGTVYRRFHNTPDGWGSVPYGGVLFRREAARVVGPFNVAVDPSRSENHFSRKLGLKYKSAFVQLQTCDSAAAAHASPACTEAMTKAFRRIGDRESSERTMVHLLRRPSPPDFVTWDEVSKHKAVNPPLDDEIFAYEAFAAAASRTRPPLTNPLLTHATCEPDFDIKIYVYDLPSRFGADALEDHATKCKRNTVCYWHSCLTGPFALESRLHAMLLKSPHRTMDPEEADMFFVPLYLICSLLAPSTKGTYELKYTADMLADAAGWLNSTGPWFARYAGEDHIWPFARDFGAHLPMVALKHGMPAGPDRLVSGPAMNRPLAKLIRNGVFVGHFGVTAGSTWPGAWTYRRGRDIVVPTITYNAQVAEVERHCRSASSRAEKKRCVENELIPKLVYAEINVTQVAIKGNNALAIHLELIFTRPFPAGCGVHFSLDLQKASNECQHGPFLGSRDNEVRLSPPDVFSNIARCSVDKPVHAKTVVTVSGINASALQDQDMDVFANAMCVNCSHATPIFLRGLHGLDERAKIAILSARNASHVYVKHRPQVESYIADPGRYLAVFGGSVSDRQYVMFRRKTGAISANGSDDVEVENAHYANGLRDRMYKKWLDDPLVNAFTHAEYRKSCNSYVQELANARFAIHAAGWSPWTQRFHESLVTATIPVVVSPDYEFPYEDLIDHRKYTIKLNNETQIANLGAFLSSLPSEVVTSKAAHLSYALALQTWEDDRDAAGVCNAFRLFLVSVARRARKFKNGMNSAWV